MHRPFAQFDQATEEEILGMVRERRGQPTGAKRHGKRNYGPKGGGSGGTGLTADDLDRTCLTAKALNFSGRDIPPGHVGWVETDANELDLGQVYPVGSGGIAAEFDTFLSTTAADIALPTAFGDDDLVLGFAINGTEINTTLTSSWASPGGAEKASYAFFDDLAGPNFQLSGNWGNHFPDQTVFPAGDHGSASSPKGGYLILRNVRRRPTAEHGTFLDDADRSSLVLNGLETDIHNAIGFSGDAIAPSNGIPTRYNAAFAQGLITGSERDSWTRPASKVYPVGTQFLVAYYYNKGTFNASPKRLGLESNADLIPTESRLVMEYQRNVNFNGHDENLYAIHLTPPTTSAGVAPLSEWLEKYSGFTDLPKDGSADETLQLYALYPDNLTEPILPAPTCNPLILREVPREAGYTADAGSKSAAKKTLAKARLRRPVVAKGSIDNNGSGVVVWGGVTQAWVYRRNFTDRYAGIAPENATREEVYGTAIGDEIGRIGRYYKKLKQGGDDPRLGYFFGRPDLLFSQASCGPVEIVQWGRDGAAANAIEVTLTATRTSASGSGVVGTWDAYELSTGASVLPDQPWTVPIPDASLLLTLDAFSSGNRGRALWIDLGQDGGASPPLYGDSVANVLEGESTDGNFGWLLFYNRTLLVYPKLTPWQAVADAGEVTDTIVFTGSGADATYSPYAPWIFADPVTHPASFASLSPTPTFADWPEVWPEAPGQVPEGSNLTVDDAYDPYFGRALGKDAEGVALSPSDPLYKTDQRLGLQLAVIRFLDHCPGAGSAGGCC